MLERGTPLEALEGALSARGHAVAIRDLNSGLHGIVMYGVHPSGEAGAFARAPGRGRWAGGADPRREGTARGTPATPTGGGS